MANNCFTNQVIIHANPDIIPNITATNAVHLDPGATEIIQISAIFHNQGGISSPTAYRYYWSTTDTITRASSPVDSHSIDATTDIVEKKWRNLL